MLMTLELTVIKKDDHRTESEQSQQLTGIQNGSRKLPKTYIFWTLTHSEVTGTLYYRHTIKLQRPAS
jgi:hypothetical protein